jgi:energy-coupling factor transporter ATP-binding protein EcfA2
MIQSVTLRRFKRFTDETFDLSGHVILAGPNNCGKTTVLQALSAWALALRSWQTLHVTTKHHGVYAKQPLTRQEFTAVPMRTFDLLWTNRVNAGPVEIAVTLASGAIITMEFIRDSTAQIYVRPHKSTRLDVLRSLAPEIVYLATVGGLSLEEPVYQPAYIENLLGQQRPGEVVRNLLYRASQGTSWDKLFQSVKRLFDIELMVPQAPGGTIICEYRHQPGGPAFDLLSAGSGFKQVVLLLASLFTRQGSVILVDEPDAHLHVFLQDAIFTELKRAAAETNSQLILATHSEVIFNRAEPEELCVMLGQARRLNRPEEVRTLRESMGILDQSDLVLALAAPGVLYVDGYTDVNLLRSWARVLRHPAVRYLNRTPYFKPMTPPEQDGREQVVPKRHFEALKLAKPEMTGIQLLDGDAKPGNMTSSPAPTPGALLRQIWTRYEIESYLLHPTALARFLDTLVGSGGADTVEQFFTSIFDQEAGAGLGAGIAQAFLANPSTPAGIVESYFVKTKARTLIEALLKSGGLTISYTEFWRIAEQMLPAEIHPEVIEKLDFIQQAFGL